MRSVLLGIFIGFALITIYKKASTSNKDVDSSFENHNYSVVNKVQRGLSSLESESNSQASTISETFFIQDGNGVVKEESTEEAKDSANQKPQDKSTLLEDQKQFSEYLKEDYRWWIENFESAVALQNSIIKQKNIKKYGLNDTDKANLKTHLVLSIILNLSMAEVMAIEDFELSSYKWSLINNFVNSEDFDKMIKYKELNPVYLEFDNLAMYYSNKRSIIRNEDGQDLKKSAPSVEDNSDYIDENSDD